MTWGIFNDEGCCEECNATTKEGAEAEMAERYPGEDADGLFVAELCHDHPEQPHGTCEECADHADDCDCEECAEDENEDG